MTTQQPTARQRMLFQALLADFLNDGFADFTIDAAAARHRCSKSTLYALGSSRDEIIRRVLISFFKEVARRTHAAAGAARSPAMALEAYFDAVAGVMEPASAPFMRDVASHPVAREIYSTNTAAATQRITALLTEGVRSGEFRDIPVEVISTFAHACLERIQQGACPQTPAAQAYRELGELMVRGLRSHPGEA